jgi:Major Facilitator Superfamily
LLPTGQQFCQSNSVSVDNDVNPAHRSKSRSRKTFSSYRALLAERNFRVFFTGYATSLLGSAMSTIALTFAVLGSGGSAAELGYVFAAAVLPEVAFMVGGGVLADRVGRRRVMLTADACRVVVQAVLAAAVLVGRPPTWLFAVCAGLLGTGEAFFNPALGGLTPHLVKAARLADANAMLGVAQSAARVAGPAAAGLLIAVTTPAAVIALDAASFAVSVLALARLRVPDTPGAAGAPDAVTTPDAKPGPSSPWRDLADGWAQFRAQAWLCLTTAQFALFNLFTWAPYLLLGPILARQYLGGAGIWGVITAANAAGAIAAGAAIVGRKPRRPLLVAVAATFGYAAPCLALALHAPAAAVAVGAAAAGVAGSVFGTYWSTVMQQRVAPELLARTTAFALTGSYALGAAGYAVIGPVAALFGAGRVLGFAAAYATLSSAIMMMVPAIRDCQWKQLPDL